MTPPFFYGWIIVAISMLAGFFSAGVSNITMAVVLKPISDELGWSRSLTAAAVRREQFQVVVLHHSSDRSPIDWGRDCCCPREERWWGCSPSVLV